MEYLKKSDVMAIAGGIGYVDSFVYNKFNNLPTYTHPAPTDAPSDADAISRKDLRDKITKQYLENEIPVGWNASINALLRIIEAMPPIQAAPSVSSKPEPGKLVEMIDDLYPKAQSGYSWTCILPILKQLAARVVALESRGV